MATFAKNTWLLHLSFIYNLFLHQFLTPLKGDNSWYWHNCTSWFQVSLNVNGPPTPEQIHIFSQCCFLEKLSLVLHSYYGVLGHPVQGLMSYFSQQICKGLFANWECELCFENHLCFTTHLYIIHSRTKRLSYTSWWKEHGLTLPSVELCFSTFLSPTLWNPQNFPI